MCNLENSLYDDLLLILKSTVKIIWPLSAKMSRESRSQGTFIDLCRTFIILLFTRWKDNLTLSLWLILSAQKGTLLNLIRKIKTIKSSYRNVLINEIETRNTVKYLLAYSWISLVELVASQRIVAEQRIGELLFGAFLGHRVLLSHQ